MAISEKLDLLLIKPADRKRVYNKLGSSLAAVEPPLWAALLAAYVREKEYSGNIIDAEISSLSPEDAAEKISNLKPLLVGFIVTGTNLSASTWNMTGARDYISALKNKSSGVKTFLWGLHPSAIPERTLTEELTDYICQGEGFITIAELLERIKSNTKCDDIPGLWYFNGNVVKGNPRPPLIKNLDELPSPAWDLLPMDRYTAHNWHCFGNLDKRQPYGVIFTSLGCPFSCSFCALKALFGAPGIRYRSPHKVIEDIDKLVTGYGIKNIKVLDECFVLNEDHVIDICDLIIECKYDLNIWAYARINTVNERILDKMKHAGFNWICYGIESPHEKTLSGVSKKGFGSDDVRRVVNMTKKAGINVLGNFMLGLPDDELESMEGTLKFATELNCEYTNFYATMAYPGSQLYEEALRNNVTLPKNWSGYSAFSKECLPLPTRHLSSKEIISFRDEAFVRFHSNPVYLDMIEQKFGRETVRHINQMLKNKLERDLLKTVEKE